MHVIVAFFLPIQRLILLLMGFNIEMQHYYRFYITCIASKSTAKWPSEVSGTEVNIWIYKVMYQSVLYEGEREGCKGREVLLVSTKLLLH